jgi:hypothetical protein
MRDTFFTSSKCDRCPNDLSVRTMSWFNEDTICMECANKEHELRQQLPNNGRDHEGCGYIPKIGA